MTGALIKFIHQWRGREGRSREGAAAPRPTSSSDTRTSISHLSAGSREGGSNGSVSTLPAGCCAFLNSGLKQGVTFISQMKAQDHPDVVVSRKMTLMWLHTCASLGYTIGRAVGGPGRRCLGSPVLPAAPDSDRFVPLVTSLITSELSFLYLERIRKRASREDATLIEVEDALSNPAGSPLPLVLVIMPIYVKDSSALDDRLVQALDVLAGQVWMPIAVILVDDCSPVNIAERFEANYHSSFVIKKRSSGQQGISLSGTWRSNLNVLTLRLDKNRGPAAARNAGLEAACTSLLRPPPGPPLLSQASGSSLISPGPLCPMAPSQMVIACLLDFGCVPSSIMWTSHHASAQASIGSSSLTLTPEVSPRPSMLPTLVISSSNLNGVVLEEQPETKMGGLVVGRAMSSKALDSVGVYHDLFGTLNCRKLEDGTLLYGTSCNMSLPLHLFLSTRDQKAHPPKELICFDESFPAAAFEDVMICLQARALGLPLVEDASNESSVLHDYDYSSYGLFRQYMRYGKHEWRILSRHQDYLAQLSASYITSNY